jgi:hypothetical protein
MILILAADERCRLARSIQSDTRVDFEVDEIIKAVVIFGDILIPSLARREKFLAMAKFPIHDSCI